MPGRKRRAIAVSEACTELEVVWIGVVRNGGTRAAGESLEHPRNATAEDDRFGAVPAEVFNVRVVREAAVEIERGSDDHRARIGNVLHGRRGKTENRVPGGVRVIDVASDRLVEREHGDGESGKAERHPRIAADEERLGSVRSIGRGWYDLLRGNCRRAY